MPNALATVLAFIAFAVSGWTSYLHYAQENESVPAPIAIVDYMALADVVNLSKSKEEQDLMLQLIAKQIDSLEAAGYLVLDMKGDILRVPESMMVTAKDLGLK